MFLNQTKKITVTALACLVAVASVFTISCQKELSGDGFIITETPPDLTSRVSSSVTGFVTNESDAAVNGATVQFGTSTATTDKYGYFEFSNVNVVKNAAVVTVIKPGYFKGIKTYIASTGKSAFFRIKLLPKTTAGTFDAAAGGNVSLANGLAISFPAASVIVASSGSAYTGQVSVAAQWINPTGSDLNRVMPGDLRGLDSLGFMRVLTTYGMSAVELAGTSGELLQIALGKKASVTFPIPAVMTSAAPASIPLWHFNETNGLWIQEGNAVKSGSSYVGEVSHFSYWNCDLPNSTVPLTFTVVNANGGPLSNTFVDIRPTSPNSWSHAGGYTDSSGYVSILVTPNTTYTLYVYADCSTWGTPSYTQDFSVGTTAVNLGNITVTGPMVANVSGTVECSGAPLGNAYVIMTKGYYNYRYPVNADGTYSFTTTLCGGSTAVNFVAENLSTLQAGNSISYTLNAGNNTVPALGACVNSIDQFINYTINGTSYALAFPTDSLYHYVNTQTNPIASSVYGSATPGSVTNGVNFQFTQDGIAAGSSQILTSFFASPVIPDSNVTLSGTPIVNITEYGNVGEFIAGNFVCTVTAGPPPGTAYNVTCFFRIRRRQ
ncbi:MAG: hypothetical protein IPP72_11435 [Chitinophagaceae bacterium]|nr:hypothetical protein [Chitinophagaceae bacterium]